MPLKFFDLCQLLSELESYCNHKPPLLPATLRRRYFERISQWFRSHNVSVDSREVDAVELLSTFFPQRRTDRVYSLQSPSLARRLRRCLCLGPARWPQLDQWQTSGRGDLGDCVERLLGQAEFPVQPPKDQVTLREVDVALAAIAKRNSFSNPEVRACEKEGVDMTVEQALSQIYRRLQSREAKWFTRIILKDIGSLNLSELMVLRCMHPRLPDVIKVHSNFEAAILVLRSQGLTGLPKAGQNDDLPQGMNLASTMIPSVGVKVGRPTYLKARSVKHALNMIGGRRMSVERKYDGEYCQIQVDTSKGDDWLKIFSKSGKDSTADREGLRKTIRECLRIDGDECGFSRKCILEGEIVVWSQREGKILDFHKIRKHVSRSGRFLGTSLASQPHDYENLMIVFYDVTLIDDVDILNQPHNSRRRALEKLVTKAPGQAELVARKLVDFSAPSGASQLQELLANAFVRLWEGLVLKPSNEPYFSSGRRSDPPYSSCWIKLKKDYIAGLGDTADFAVVGARYSVSEAPNFGNIPLGWNQFHIGCLTNKDDVIRLGSKPHFTVIDAFNQSISPEDVKRLNQLGEFRALKMGSAEQIETFDLTFERGIPKMTVAFREPFVFEVMGAGFDMKANRTTFSLRWPRVLKIHWDRDWKEAVTAEELQQMASEARLAPAGNLAEDVADWIERLKQVDRGVKQVLAPSLDSQEAQGIIDAFSPGQSPSTSRRRGALSVPPMVRMDTIEMVPGETRLATGEVLCYPNSRQLNTNVEHGCSLLTPPSSALPLVAVSHNGAVQTPCGLSGGSSSTARKHAANWEITGDDEARTFKKARRMFKDWPAENHSTSAKAMHSGTSQDTLREITKSSSRRHPGLSIKSTGSGIRRESNTKSFVVRKIPVGAKQHLDLKVKKSRHAVEESSPGRETTASAYTTDGTSQRTEVPDHGVEDLEEEVPTSPRSTTPPPIDSLGPAESARADVARSRTRIPDILHAQLILAPCVAYTPYLTDDLFSLLGISALPFAEALALFPNSTDSKGLILLIESKRKNATSALLKELATHLPRWGRKEVEIWDWTVVEALCEEKDDDAVRTCFWGRMSWDAENRKVVMQWPDGQVSRG